MSDETVLRGEYKVPGGKLVAADGALTAAELERGAELVRTTFGTPEWTARVP